MDMDRNDRLIRIIPRIRVLRLLKERELQQRRHRQQRPWVRPVLAAREEQGEFAALVEQLRADPDGHHKYFRTLPAEFDFLIHVKADIEKVTTNMRRPIPPGERLALTVR